jgi:nucleoside-diphosphate-sugar epimerase
MRATPVILVTGAAGHLGAALGPALAAEGCTAIGLDCRQPAATPGYARFLVADLVDRPALDAAVRGVALVIHTASIHPARQADEARIWATNVAGAWTLWSAALAAGVGGCVLTSSIAVVDFRAYAPAAWPLSEDDLGGDVDSLYGLTKRTQEAIARMHAAALPTIALRPPAFETGCRNQHLLGGFIRVEDLVTAHLAAVRVLIGRQAPPEPLRPFEAFTTTQEHPYTAADFLSGFNAQVGPAQVLAHWPHAADRLATCGFTGMWLPAVFTCAKARRLLGWQARHDAGWWLTFDAGAAPHPTTESRAGKLLTEVR